MRWNLNFIYCVSSIWMLNIYRHMPHKSPYAAVPPHPDVQLKAAAMHYAILQPPYKNHPQKLNSTRPLHWALLVVQSPYECGPGEESPHCGVCDQFINFQELWVWVYVCVCTVASVDVGTPGHRGNLWLPRDHCNQHTKPAGKMSHLLNGHYRTLKPH